MQNPSGRPEQIAKTPVVGRPGELPPPGPFCIQFMKPGNDSGFGPETLFDFQLRVARRADEIAQAQPRDSALNLHCWLLAEHEVLSGKLPGALMEAPPGVARSE